MIKKKNLKVFKRKITKKYCDFKTKIYDSKENLAVL